MASLGGGLAGAGAGFATGGPVGAAIGGLAGLFGSSGRPQEDPITRQNRLLQSNVANQLYQFGTGVPGSDPGEQAAYAQERGQLGSAQRNAQQQLFGQYNPAQGTNGLADMMQRLSNQQVGQQMSLQESHLISALSQRRQALLDAANVSGRAAQTGPVYQPQSDLPQVLGQVAAQIARNKALNQGQGGQGGGNGGIFGGAGMPNTSTGGYGTYTGSNTAFGGAPGSSGAVPTAAAPTGAPDFLGALPPPLYLSQDAMTQGVGAGSQPANAAAGAAAPPAAANAPFGPTTNANQFRQSLGLSFGGPFPWNNPAGGLRF